MNRILSGSERAGAAALALLVLILGNVPAAEAAIGDHHWSMGYDAGGFAALDGSGNVLSAGTFFGPTDFGGGTLTPVNFLGGDVFLARFDGNGAHVWSQQVTPGGFGVIVDAVAASPAGDLYVAGTIQGTGTIDFGGGVLSGSGTSFLAAFNPAGTHLWSTNLGTGRVTALAATSSHVVLTGYSYGTMDFGGGPVTSAGGADAFLAAYTSAGAGAWGAMYGDTADQGGLALAVDGSGNVVLVAGTTGSIDFGSGPLAPAFGTGLVVASFTSAGAPSWSVLHAGTFTPGSGILLSVALDARPGGDFALAGEMSGSVDFGGGPLTATGSFDAFVAVFDAAGAHQRSAHYGGSSHDGARGVAFDGSGNVWLTGVFLSTDADFGGGTFSPGGFGSDFFVAMYDASGAHQWSASYGQNGQWGITVDCDPSGNPVLSGTAAGGLDFGGGALASANLFLAELDDGAGGTTAAPTLPAQADLRCFPNPFRPSTTIAFTVERETHATLEVLDVAGRRVATLTDRRLAPGPHAVTWSGRTTSGHPLPGGVYFYRLQADRKVTTGKVVRLD